MFEALTPGHGAGRKPRTIRLSVEELEGRCLLSGGFGPLGGITTGPDGEIWFLEKDRLGRLDPTTGLIQEFAQGINTGYIAWDGENRAGQSIAEAPDGSLWFLSNGQLTRFTPSTNTLSTFNLSPGSTPWDSITIGPDGTVWVLEQHGQDFGIARVDPVSGAVQDFDMGQIWGMGGPPAGIGFGPDGKIWITRNVLPLEEMDPVTGALSISNTTYKYEQLPPKIAADGTYWDLFPSGVPRAGDEALRQYDPATGNYAVFNSATDIGFVQLTPGPGGNIYYTYVDGRNADGTFAYFVGEFNPATGAIETFSTANLGQPSTAPATGKNVSAIASINFLTAVASFTPQAPIASPGKAYQATISWGDGTTSSLVLTVTKNGTYDIIAGHTYEKAGTYTIKVTIGTYNPSNPLGDNPITVFGTANVDPFTMNMW